MSVRIISFIGILILLSAHSRAQVGINTETPRAELDVQGGIENTFIVDVNFSDDTDGITTGGSPVWTVQNYLDSLCFSTNNTIASQTSEVYIDFTVPPARRAYVTFDLHVNLTVNGLLSVNNQVYTSANNTDWTKVAIPFFAGKHQVLIVMYGDGSSNLPGKVAIDNVQVFYEDGFALRIDDSSQNEGYVLTSDDFGNATWQESRPGILVDDDGDTFVDAVDNNSIVKTTEGSEVYFQNKDSLDVLADRIVFGTSFSFNKATSNGTVVWGALNESSGPLSTSWGANSIASGTKSTAWGDKSTASNDHATAWGKSNEASGINSTALGQGTIADTLNAVAMGFETTATGGQSLAVGYQSNASGDQAVVFGRNCGASGNNSFARGDQCFASGDYSSAWGFSSFGTSQGATAWGNTSTASGSYSTAWGSTNLALSSNSTAWGNNNLASGSSSTAWGSSNEANENLTTVWGFSNRANEQFASVWGVGNVAAGNSSTMWGSSNISDSYLGTTFGRASRNLTSNSSLWIPDDPLVQIGNGTQSDRQDALIILKNGNIGINFGETDGNPQYKLHVLGQIVGDNVAASSDARIKREQKPLAYGLGEVRKLAPKSYNQYAYTFPESGFQIKGEGKPSIGLIAQEVYELVPEAVLVPEDENKNIWHLDYTKLVPVLINATKELDETDEQLLSKISSLEDEIKMLKEELAKFQSLELRIAALEKLN